MSGLLVPFEICLYSDHVCFRLWWHWCNVGTCVLCMTVFGICICSMSFWLYFISFLCVVVFCCDNDCFNQLVYDACVCEVHELARHWYLSYASRIAYVTVGSGVRVDRWSIPSRPVERFSAWLGKPASYTLCGPLGMTPLYKFEVHVRGPVAAEDRIRQERHRSRCPVQRQPEYDYFDYFHDTDKRWCSGSATTTSPTSSSTRRFRLWPPEFLDPSFRRANPNPKPMPICLFYKMASIMCIPYLSCICCISWVVGN